MPRNWTKRCLVRIFNSHVRRPPSIATCRRLPSELFEHSGGVADWPAAEASGSVVVPPEVARAAHLPGEEFSLGETAAPGTLQVSLAGEFLDMASRVLDVAVPRDGSFCIPERYLTSRDLTEKIDHTFGWQNARASYSTAEPALVEYHLWTLLGSLRSEDVWEAIFHVAVNAESQAVVELPDVFREPDLHGDESAKRGRRPDHLCYGDCGRKTAADDGIGGVCPPDRATAGAGSQAASGLLSSPGAKPTARSAARRRLPHRKKSRRRSGRWIWSCAASWPN